LKICGIAHAAQALAPRVALSFIQYGYGINPDFCPLVILLFGTNAGGSSVWNFEFRSL
jgi:hypothetical protein